MATREVEVRVRALEVVGPAITPPIQVAFKEGEALPAEELRLKNRILDLRRPELQQNFVLRHRLLQRAHRSMTDQGFLEIETPILTKPTPEGARDYLVPSRLHAGEFYALPQSPQIYKQLLMVAGFDRYFQIARCFRDEDLRADRQPEFTQIDLEASFVSKEEVQGFVEQVLVDLWDEAGHRIARPFPRLSYVDAMERFGLDKPDLRYGWEIRDLTRAVAEVGGGEGTAASFVGAALAEGGRLRGIVVPGGAKFTRREIDALTQRARDAGAGGLIWARRGDAEWEGQGVKALGADTASRIEATPGDLLLAVAGSDDLTSPVLAAVRAGLIARPDAEPSSEHASSIPNRESRCPPIIRSRHRTPMTSRYSSVIPRGAGRRTTMWCITVTSWAAGRSESPTSNCSGRSSGSSDSCLMACSSAHRPTGGSRSDSTGWSCS
jgi:aspartyl-tRNA synthetase